MYFSELRSKEVISIKDCRKLGHISDLEFDHCNGCIKKIIVSKKCHFFSACLGESDCVIPYSEIKQIGPDIVLVDV